MNNSPSNCDENLAQRIKDAENLLEEKKGWPKDPDVKPELEVQTRDKIYQVLNGLLPEVECRNGTLSHEKAEYIASLISGLTERERHGNEYLRDYLVRLIIFCHSSRHMVKTAVSK